MRTVSGKTLTTYQVAPDGETFRLNFRDEEGRPASVVLAADCANQLVLTLPAIARQALQARHRDSSLRLVYPMADWQLEQNAGDDRLILTLATDGGFSVSFAVSAAQLQEMLGGAADAPARKKVQRGLH